MGIARSAIPVEVVLGCAKGLVMDGDRKVMVPWMRGIDRRWSVAREFRRRVGAALSALFWPGKKKKGRGPPLLGWRGERGEEKSSSVTTWRAQAAGEAVEESSGEEKERKREI